jgi:dephospho-CoA kinase
MHILGLTGSMGMGKSTVSQMMRQMGVPVFEADATVHHLMAHDTEVRRALAEAFPACIDLSIPKSPVNRSALGAVIFQDPEKKKILESILHPAVARRRGEWLSRYRRFPLVVFDVPLLFETGMQDQVDAVVVVSAPSFVQRHRVLRRPGMTQERLTAILNHQWPDAQKRRHADVVLQTGGSLGHLRRQVRGLVAVPEKKGTLP